MFEIVKERPSSKLSGFSKLDDNGGLINQGLVVVVADPRVDLNAFLLSCMFHHVKTNAEHKASVFCYNEHKDYLYKRLVSMHAEIELKDLLKANFSESAEKLKQAHCYINRLITEQRLKLKYMLNTYQQIKRHLEGKDNNDRLVVLSDLNSLKEPYDEVLPKLKRLALNHKVTFLTSYAVNTSKLCRPDERPKISDLPYDIQHRADQIIGLHIPFCKDDIKNTELLIIKNYMSWRHYISCSISYDQRYSKFIKHVRQS